jgi:cell division protein FtsB
MRGFRQQKQNMLKVLGLRILTVILLLVLFALIRGGWNVYLKQRETYVNKIDAEARLEELSDRKNQLQAEVLHLKSGRGIEEEMRQQFEVAREGEGLIIIVDRPKSGDESNKVKGSSWWKPLWPW